MVLRSLLGTAFAVSLVCTVQADSLKPNLSSWYTDSTGRYAQIYETVEDESAGSSTAVTTWARGQGTQSSPTYVGVHEVSYTEDWIYVRTTGLGTHIMGPWYLNESKTELFSDYPSNQSTIYRMPRISTTDPVTKILTGDGTIGIFVDGVSMHDSRDSFSYDTSAGKDDSSGEEGVSGDDVWNRDAFLNGAVTFDAANAHQSGATYHYHVNPSGLRHQLGDSVDYDSANNRYTENFNEGHSPILAWVSDGYPLYGPYGYSEAMNPESEVTRMRSGFRKRSITQRQSLPAYAARDQGYTMTESTLEYSLPASLYGPEVNENFVLGHYIEDYEYLGDFSQVQGEDFDLDEHNGRFCVTPEFPQGTYAYFVSIESDGTAAYPYNMGRRYYGNPVGSVVASIPNEAVTAFEGGPEKLLKEGSIAHAGNEVAVTWSAVQGGTYLTEASDDLSNWQVVANELNDDELKVVETGSAEKRFYQSTLLELAPYDEEGFVVGSQASVGRNNVLLIIVDDWGIDSSPLDNPGIGTHASMPTLTSLASQGLRFTNAYAQPTCSPTRANILTGRYSFRHGVGSPGGVNFPESEFTLPDAFAAANSTYALASFGKWHLGGGDAGPKDLGGWDEFRGSLASGVDDYYDWSKTVNGVTTENVSTYVTTDQVNDAVNFITTQGETPWMCWLAFNAPHAPYHEPPSHLLPSNPTGTGSRELFEKSLEAMDTELARLLESVDLTKTNVLIIGDNGTGGGVVQSPFVSGKAKQSLYEGGVRVPFIALGPDVRARGTCDDLVHCTDLYTTILELAGIEPTAVVPEGVVIDGRSLFPALNGSSSLEGPIVVEDFGGVDDPGRAIREGDYKLIFYDDGTEEFYHVVDDISENEELLQSGLNAKEQVAYNSIVAYNNEINSLGHQTNATGVLSASPMIGTVGEQVVVTLSLDPADSNIPVSSRAVEMVTLGSEIGISVSRPSRYVVEATFTLPESAGVYDLEVIFTGPENRTFGLNDGFTVEE